jgi:hypothetical protein
MELALRRCGTYTADRRSNQIAASRPKGAVCGRSHRLAAERARLTPAGRLALHIGLRGRALGPAKRI